LEQPQFEEDEGFYPKKAQTKKNKKSKRSKRKKKKKKKKKKKAVQQES